MPILPFICLSIGILLGIFIKNKYFIIYSGKLSTIALSLLMLSIGLGIGIDNSIMENFLKIGFNCIIISFSAIIFSVIFTIICEKTVLPLKQLDEELEKKNITFSTNSVENQEETNEVSDSDSKLVWIMPGSLIFGLILGVLFQNNISSYLIDMSFSIFLTILYICVGISQGSDKDIFNYLKLLGIKIIWLSFAILIGSITGGFIAGKLLNIPLNISVISASGMCYYSIAGAFMTNTYGLEVGTYGFIVNILREVFTILLMPILIKISLGSPIAGGGAGNMDTMLMPVTKFVGARLGMVTLLTGTILTFIVPILLPLLASLF